MLKILCAKHVSNDKNSRENEIKKDLYMLHQKDTIEISQLHNEESGFRKFDTDKILKVRRKLCGK